MPELPEVETIKKGLTKYLIGHKIRAVDIKLSKMFHGNPGDIIGSIVIAVRRLGKGLIIDLDNGVSICVHVKMTGQLLYISQESKTKKYRQTVGQLPGPYTHIIISLDQNAQLFYNDMRQFGWMKIMPTADVLTLSFFKSLGPEPLKDLTFEKFKEIIKESTRPIKNVLMDQKKMSGIGNIYANDALYVAKIHPNRPALSLTSVEQQRLFVAIEEVLREGVEKGGASQWHYVNVLGEKGSYQKSFRVYGKERKPCLVCGSIIQKMKIGQRGTFFCEICQR